MSLWNFEPGHSAKRVQDRVMVNPAQTEGEALFEQYLQEMGYAYEFEKTFPGKTKKPDYSILHDGEFLFEVKDFEESLPTLGFGAYDPYPLIRQKINQAREKFDNA